MHTDEAGIASAIRRYGEEKFAKRIARAIKNHLQENELTTTRKLVEIIRRAVPGSSPHKHPATRTFQAIRIVVNDELAQIESVLPASVDALVPGGRLAVISFHSLEDRIVKRFFREQARGDPFPADLPVTRDMLHPRVKPVGKAIRPTQRETAVNPRARSAVLRAVEKLP